MLAVASLAILFISLQGPTVAKFIGGGVVVAFTVGIWMLVIDATRSVHIDPATAKVEVAWRTATFRWRRAEFPLERFASVVSYWIRNGRSDVGRVELVTASGRQFLLLASCPVTYRGNSFWNLNPQPKESDEARCIRESVAQATGLKDEGYVGLRDLGEQLL